MLMLATNPAVQVRWEETLRQQQDNLRRREELHQRQVQELQHCLLHRDENQRQQEERIRQLREAQAKREQMEEQQEEFHQAFAGA